MSDVWGRGVVVGHINCGRGHQIREDKVRKDTNGNLICVECDMFKRILTKILA